MTLLDAILQMEKIRKALELTYGGAFRSQLPYGGGTYQPPRFGWEVRICSGAKKLDEAILKLRSACVEAEPFELAPAAEGKPNA